MKKKIFLILGLVLTASFIGIMEVKALSKQKLSEVDGVERSNARKANVIDISSHQKADDIDFDKWKEQGVEAVVIKLTEGMEDGAPYYNPEAKGQIEKALAAGLKVNFYHYSWMTSSENAIEEADWFSKIADQYNIPKDSVMALDLENPILTQDASELTNQANAFFDRMIENGYPKVDVYASLGWFGTRFITEELRADNYWVASWSEEKPEIDTGMWQFTDNYQLEGYDGPLDGNIDFTGFYTQREE